MKIHNAFHIPLPPARAWDVLNDVPRVAQCVPGAKLLEQKDGDTYVGTVAVRLGPVSLSFKGTVTYQEIDAANYRVRAVASGNEQRARGTANATVVFHLEDENAGTAVKVDTDLQLAGAIAQYGRGGALIENTAQVLMDQFAKNLEAEIAAAESAPPVPAAASSGATPAEPPPAKPQAAKEISGLTLVFLGLRRTIKHWFARLFGKAG